MRDLLYWQASPRLKLDLHGHFKVAPSTPSEDERSLKDRENALFVGWVQVEGHAADILTRTGLILIESQKHSPPMTSFLTCH